MPRMTKRPVWIVSVFGGEYEDAWEHARSVFADKAMAEIAPATSTASSNTT